MLDFKDDIYRQFIYYRTYSRWREELGRREDWHESVTRYMDFMKAKLGKKLSKKEYQEVETAIVEMEVMPSMRLIWGAGDAAGKTNTIGYNCAFTTPTKFKNFGEILYLLTCGCGVGFSVEEKFVNQLPDVKIQTKTKLDPFVVLDSREGWADAVVRGLSTWYDGNDITFDYSLIRPLGAKLKTMGGRASGPEPLRSLLEFTREIVFSRQGRKLRPIDVHDIITKIGEVVVAGGTRRSAEISLSDLNDADLRYAKAGSFWETTPNRSMANNSAVYNEKPQIETFMREWTALMESGTGERGIFNRSGVMPDRRAELLGDRIHSLGTNPCGEILLQPKQFCNLSEVIARSYDTRKTLLEKIRLAAILGTYQSTLTDFGYLSKEWQKNSEEERLLGVSVTGQQDCPAFRDNPKLMKELRDYAVEINKEYAKKMGINQSTSVTAVKPSGTVSQLVNASSGLHARFAPYYVRRVRISSTDPLFALVRDAGVPYYPEVGQQADTAHTFVLEFPIASPDDATFADDLTAIEQLEYWKKVKENYTEHNPSATIYVGAEEWLEVGSWVYKHWYIVGGLSFLPREDHIYQLAPYEKISRKTYEKMLKAFPELDFTELTKYESDDNTTGAKEAACAGGTCEIGLDTV